MSLKSGHKIIPLGGKEQEQQMNEFRAYAVGTMRLQPDGWFFTTPFIEYADKLYDYKFKETDVLVMTYPKSGTTWTQEIIWTMRNNPDLNHPMAGLPVKLRSLFMEMDFLWKGTYLPVLGPSQDIFDMFTKFCPDKDMNDGIYLQLMDNLPDPRTIKTHLPFSLLAKNLLDTCKVIYMIRNPKDVVTSYHHHSRLLKPHGYIGTLDSFVDHFLDDKLMYGPFWTHAKEAWDKREHPNIHFIFYEDMKKSPKEEIIRLQNFLGTNLDDKQIDNIVEYTSFSEMKARDGLISTKLKSESSEELSLIYTEVLKNDGSFFRKGVVGDYKNKLTDEQIRKINDWTKKNVDRDFGPEFKYFE